MKTLPRRILPILTKPITALRVRLALLLGSVLVSAALLTTGIINAETASYIIGATSLLAPAIRHSCRDAEPEQPRV